MHKYMCLENAVSKKYNKAVASTNHVKCCTHVFFNKTILHGPMGWMGRLIK